MVSNRATHDMRRFGTICIIFKKEKHPWRNATFSKPATLRKVSLLHECFRPFLNCTNGTKSRKVLHDKNIDKLSKSLAPWCKSGPHYCTTLFSKSQTQALRKQVHMILATLWRFAIVRT